jgi:outer membrane protein OmpA-like peptidoglycan-associated protein
MRLFTALLILCVLAPTASAWKRRDRDEVWDDQVFDDELVRADKELRAILDKIKRGDIPKVQFDFDKSEVRPESFTALNMIADILLKRPSLKLKIVAHTCTIGSAEYNLKLSDRRAKSVMDYLVQRGVPPPSMRYRGAGYSEPIADNSTEEGREKNRRVEFRLTRRDWNAVY